MKAFLIDVKKCVGCHDCQVGCKDEHCGNDWSPYAKPQPDTGQFWCKVDQKERGHKPHVKVSYIPRLCNHCENAPCMKAATGDAVYRRDDGLVLIDPEKAKGQKQIVEACPYHVIYWNEALNIPQKCTGCAHLLDDASSPIRVPRCVDNCHVNVIMFGEEDQLGLDGTEEVLHPQSALRCPAWGRASQDPAPLSGFPPGRRGLPSPSSHSRQIPIRHVKHLSDILDSRRRMSHSPCYKNT